MSKAEPLLELASSILDGTPIDWDGAERSTPADQRELLRSLKLLSTISELHRPVDETGEHWGTFQLREQIGRGSHGEVFRAWDTSLHREVALKLLRTPSSSSPSDADASVPDPRERWLAEARRLAAVHHSSVVSVFLAQEVGGVAGIAMELIRGRTLEERLREGGTLGARELVAIGVDLCRALAAIHQAGLLHHDVKASNVMREDGGRVVLMDLGIGGATPAYMAPELLRGMSATVKTDLYSLGVLLHHLASGSYPVCGATTEELRAAHEAGRASNLRDARPELPVSLVRVIERAHAADPLDRFETAGQLAEALEETLLTAQPLPEPTRFAREGASAWRGRWTGIAAAVVLGAVVISFAFLRPRGNVTRERTESLASLGLANAGPFRIRASFERGATRELLQRGDLLALGDSLALEVESSESLFVYVVDEDAEGRSYLLFPLRGMTPGNPLPPNQPHRLPGMRGGRRYYWQVTSSGGGERLILLASRVRLVGFEADALALDRAIAGRAIEYPRIEEQSWASLRGVGGLVPEASSAGAPPRLGFDPLQPLASGWHDAQGVFAREMTFEDQAR